MSFLKTPEDFENLLIDKLCHSHDIGVELKRTDCNA
jgi:hypothetical protein